MQSSGIPPLINPGIPPVVKKENRVSVTLVVVIACLVLVLVGWIFVCGGCAVLRGKADPRIETVVQLIDEDGLRAYSQGLAEIGSRPERNGPKTALTIRFIKNALEEAGYRAVEAAATEGLEAQAKRYNIVAEIEGTERPECVVELGAHYDTVPFAPGADDNGSGVAGVLAAARALAGTRCTKTIRFVFYCGEEFDFAGSATHVQNIRDNKAERFEGAIVFEMIGYATDEPNSQRTPIRVPFVAWPPRTGNFITVVGNWKSTFIGKRYERCARAYAPDLRCYGFKRLGGLLKATVRSDHATYWEKKLPAIMLTDTANFRNPNYHRPSDRIETLNFAFMTRVTRAAAAALLDWAGAEAGTAGEKGGAMAEGNANRLTFRREACGRTTQSSGLDNPDIGMSAEGLSMEAACRQIVTRYWEAAIRDDNETASRLWSPIRSGNRPRFREEKHPEAIIGVGLPYRNDGCHFGGPTLIVPSRIRCKDGSGVAVDAIVVMRDLGLEPSCLIVGTWGRPRLSADEGRPSGAVSD